MTDPASPFTEPDVVEKTAKAANDGLFEVERRVIESHFTKRDASVLDLGCGTGRTTAVLDRMGFDVVGVDISDPMIRHARSIFPHIEFESGDATDLQFADASFEYVLFSFNGLDYVQPEEDRYVALREIRRVLNPGGTFVFSSHNSFFLLPADPMSLYGYFHLVRFWVQTILNGNVTERYKTDVLSDKTLETYFISPRGQRKQLTRCGFRLRDICVKEQSPSIWIDPWPYYVAEKPDS